MIALDCTVIDAKLIPRRHPCVSEGTYCPNPGASLSTSTRVPEAKEGRTHQLARVPLPLFVRVRHGSLRIETEVLGDRKAYDEGPGLQRGQVQCGGVVLMALRQLVPNPREQEWGRSRATTHSDRMPYGRERQGDQMDDRNAGAHERDVVVLDRAGLHLSSGRIPRYEKGPLRHADAEFLLVVRVALVAGPEEPRPAEFLFGAEELVKEPAGVGEKVPDHGVRRPEQVEQDEVRDPSERGARRRLDRGGRDVRGGPGLGEVPRAVDRVLRRPVDERLLAVKEDDLERLALSGAPFLASDRLDALLPLVKPRGQSRREVEQHGAGRRRVGRADKLVRRMGWEVLRVEVSRDDEAARGGGVVGEDEVGHGALADGRLRVEGILLDVLRECPGQSRLTLAEER